MTKLNDVEQWEVDQEMPAPLVNVRECKFLKTKCELVDDDPDDPSIEINLTHSRGLSFKFTTHKEITSEEWEDCDLGHKHRKLITNDYHYEQMHISRQDAKKLLAWLEMRIK